MNNSTEHARRVSVLVVDDSAFMRTALTRMIESDPALRIAGTAQNGMQALERIVDLQPDVVTLDVEMPGLNGLETLKRIMQEFPRPVIMVSSLTKDGAESTLEALEIGAFDCVSKQESFASLDVVKIREDLIAKIRAAAELNRRRTAGQIVNKPASTRIAASRTSLVQPTLVALGTSTGGPKALQQMLPLLPRDLAVGVLVVQHMPVGFTGPFANRLNQLCQVEVKEATHDQIIEAGVVYIAPAGRHLTVMRRSSAKVVVRLSASPEDTLHRPSVDVMMLSVAEVFGPLAMGVIMTGMGADGVQGMKAIGKAGGLTVGQDEASCTVYGMPRSCAEAGVLQRVVSLTQIPGEILQATHYHEHH
ncbi:MAG: chemotaxis response regulator protein-glutamate methylesterase [Terriglobales bacterium]